MKFTFKQDNPTGRFRSFQARHTLIKFKKKQCGNLSRKIGEDWRIGFTVKDDVRKCGWKWVFFSARFETEKEAREFVNGGAIERYLEREKKELHCFEE